MHISIDTAVLPIGGVRTHASVAEPQTDSTCLTVAQHVYHNRMIPSLPGTTCGRYKKSRLNLTFCRHKHLTTAVSHEPHNENEMQNPSPRQRGPLRSPVLLCGISNRYTQHDKQPSYTTKAPRQSSYHMPKILKIKTQHICWIPYSRFMHVLVRLETPRQRRKCSHTQSTASRWLCV